MVNRILYVIRNLICTNKYNTGGYYLGLWNNIALVTGRIRYILHFGTPFRKGQNSLKVKALEQLFRQY